ncbi:hypothetical protein OROHE_009533 [Orobanche hederae]
MGQGKNGGETKGLPPLSYSGWHVDGGLPRRVMARKQRFEWVLQWFGPDEVFVRLRVQAVVSGWVLDGDEVALNYLEKKDPLEVEKLKILEKINPNAYRLRLPSHIRTSDVLNVKHLVPFEADNFSGDKAVVDSRANRFEEEENDGDEAALNYLEKKDPLEVEKLKARSI